MTLSAFRLEPLTLTLKEPLRTARGLFERREGVLLTLQTAAGRTGTGEATPLEEFGCEPLARSIEVLNAVAPRLLGEAIPSTTADVVRLLARHAELEGAPAARHALETALLALAADAAGTPLARLLDPAAREQVEVNALLGAREPAKLASQGQDAVRRGHRVLKVKVAGCPLEEDLARLKALRGAVGPGPRIRIDANGGWSPEEALPNLRALAAFDLELCEQPVAAIEALRRVHRSSPVPIAADESVSTLEAGRALLDPAAASILVLRPMVLGGVLPALELARLAHARGVHSYVASSLDGPVARAAGLALAAALPEGRFASGLGVGELFVDLSPASSDAGSKPALVADGRTWSHAQLEQELTLWSGRLAREGLGPGDRLALLSGNRAEVVFLFHAAARVGAVLVPLSARLPAEELASLFARVRPKRIVAEAALADRVPGARVLEELAASPAGPVRPHTSAETDVRTLLFTSGTTGIAKAAELTFGNFAAAARASAANVGGAPGDRWLACLPLFHVGGLTMAHRTHAYGATLVLHPRFDAREVARAIDRDGITHLSLVATGLRWLLDAHPEPFPSTLKAVLVGGGPCPPSLLAEARARGLPVLQTWGLTEACAQVATESPADADGNTAGRPLDGNEVRVVGPDGDALGANEIGELEVRGPTVMRGYFEDAGATADSLRDGWLRTRDLGSLDAQGRITIYARRTDLILSGGENVYPAELENVLLQHPRIAEVAVVGADDALWGQVPIALLVARGEPPAPPALEQWCRARLAGFKVPRRFCALTELPRNAVGKLDRAALRRLAHQLHTAAPPSRSPTENALHQSE